MSTVINKYEGDPALYVDGHGAHIKWLGGQPVMDAGIQNCAVLALLIKPGWPGNVYIREKEQQYGSEFLDATEAPITVSMLNDVRAKGQKALDEKLVDDNLVESAEMDTINPTGSQIQTNVKIQAPGETQQELQLTKYANNWQLQFDQPAGDR